MSTYDVHLANAPGQVNIVTVEAASCVAPWPITRQGVPVESPVAQLVDSDGATVLLVPLHSLIAIHRRADA